MSQTGPSTDAHAIRDLPSLKSYGRPETPTLSQEPSVPSLLVHMSPCRTLPSPDTNLEPLEKDVDPVRHAHSQTCQQSDTPTITHTHSLKRNASPHNGTDDDQGQNSKSFQGGQRRQDSFLQPPEDDQVLLPRSSPVISRRRKKSLSWHEGIEEPYLSLSPPTAAPSLGWGEALTLGPGGMSGPAEEGTVHCLCPGLQPQDQQGASASLNRLLTSGLPLRGQLGGRGRGEEGIRLRWSCDAITKRVPNEKSKRSSDITPCHADLYKTSCNLEQENAHFVVVDLVLEVLEAVKWTLSLSQWSTGPDKHTQDRGQEAQDRGQKAQDRRQEAQDRGQKAQDRRQEAQDRGQKAQDRGQKAQDRGQKAQDRGQEAQDRGQEAQDRGQEAQDRGQKAQDRGQEAQDRGQEAQDRGQEAQDRGQEAEPKPDSHQAKTLSGVSVDSGFEFGENTADDNLDSEMELRPISRGSRFKKCFKRQSFLPPPIMQCSAECLAQQLVLQFRRRWLPSQGLRRGRQSLRTSLQELPGTAPVVSNANASLSEEIRQRTRMRGSLNWEPPHFQIIVTVLPSHRRSEVIAMQHFLCAGCGTEIEPRYMKKLRYCEYLGRYFCDCCHGGSESVIPGRVLTQWDFGKYAVSDFSKQLLDSVWHQPLFDLTCVGTHLYSRVRELDRFRELQEQLLGIKRLLMKCRLSEGVLKDFKQLPDHLTQRPHLFSMDDLVEVKRGHLLPLAKEVLRLASGHVESCQLCLAKGFICEFCKQKDVIFPFQSGICTRCQVCKACFHSACFKDEECPKCLRIKLRIQRLNTKS